MNNKTLAIVFGLLTILSVVWFIITGSLIYAGMIVFNLCAMLIQIVRNDKLVVVFMIVSLVSSLFSFYHLVMSFI
jgi:hypothetical protein